MLQISDPSALASHVGEELGRSSWRTITQADIDAFAAVTGDTNWFHTDPVRAAAEMPDGRTIAHGLFVLALAPKMLGEIYTLAHRGRGLNYGYDRVRFIRPVSVGSAVRLVLSLAEVSEHRAGTRVVTQQTFEMRGHEGPVVSARNILLILPEGADG